MSSKSERFEEDALNYWIDSIDNIISRLSIVLPVVMLFLFFVNASAGGFRFRECDPSFSCLVYTNKIRFTVNRFSC